MSIAAGFTAAEVREIVHQYQLQPHGMKAVWLAERGISIKRYRRWADAVFGGDLDRSLIPREGSPMTIPPKKRTALERARAVERSDQVAEVARLNARVRELEETNAALGKAIGLLHALSEEEPAETPTPDDPPRS